ncbi:hypothetical protein [Salmonella enterica]|uniref:hypothetical protein n=1 Tax=Salmonella enterica TaxID=28901 RepID=UPI0009E79844|nr:hypothetical protein [Salmonella enterica]EBP3538328.1 hypothetical protein [Salmonella enterica subsp. enterica]EBQ5244716.1 hypothetical protein [Salmonella enterica subsp. salamae]EDM1754377.1 hypothetical protein [Salmonella enterica subsp. diarizonae]
MTINIDSIWVIFGIATIIGFGGYVGVYWAVHLILASKKIGVLVADKIIWPLYAKAKVWGQKWTK